MKLYIGLMSGTSMDGIDAVLVDVTRHELKAALTHPYTKKTSAMLSSTLDNPGIINQLSTTLGREFAEAVHRLLATTNIALNDIIAIGSHGQTICHDVTGDIPYTVQLGCPHTIAELTGMTVVADFRSRDLILGGRGAPFAPLYHQALFSNFNPPLAIVNIGGISNITYLNEDGSVNGYDIGPGNCLMDAWIQKHLELPYDASGRWASTGLVSDALLESLLSDPYFQLAAPKSIGKEYFSLDWLINACSKISLPQKFSNQDMQATLLALTATSIAESILQSNSKAKRVLICGGGAHNLFLLKALQHQLPNLTVDSTEAIGVNPDFIEAMMFAWLADKTLNRLPVDFTTITGAKKPTLLGAIYPSPSYF